MRLAEGRVFGFRNSKSLWLNKWRTKKLVKNGEEKLLYQVSRDEFNSKSFCKKYKNHKETIFNKLALSPAKLTLINLFMQTTGHNHKPSKLLLYS